MGSTSFCSSSGCRPPTPRLQTRGPGASGQHLGAQPADLIDHLIQALAHGRLQPPWGARRPQRTPWRPESEPLRAPKGAEPPREGGDLPENRRSHPICHRLIARPPGHLARAMGLECPRALEALWSHKKADIHTERSPPAPLFKPKPPVNHHVGARKYHGGREFSGSKPQGASTTASGSGAYHETASTAKQKPPRSSSSCTSPSAPHRMQLYAIHTVLDVCVVGKGYRI